MRKVKRLPYDAGWMRWGWPERVGGLGGSPMLRTELGEALAVARPRRSGLFSLTEVLAPTLIDFAPPELAADVVPRLLRGDEMWCQGFSEPGTGSDLASLRVPRERATDDGWSVNGQKVWTSLAQYSDRCVLLTRTGSPESRHRGITAFFVDMDTPGITVATDRDDQRRARVREVFFDDVVVPADRMLGEVDGGWAVAMSILPYERTPRFWQRIAYLYRRLQQLLDAAAPDDDRPRSVGEVTQLAATRCGRGRARRNTGSPRARRSAPRRRSTRCSWPTAEQAMYRPPRAGARRRRRDRRRRADGEMWRSEYLYSRAATIYGGTRRGAAQHHRPPAPRPRRRRDGRGGARALRAQPSATRTEPSPRATRRRRR